MNKSDFRQRQIKISLKRLSRHLPTIVVLLILTVLLGTGLALLHHFVLAGKFSGFQRTVTADGRPGGSGPLSPEDPGQEFSEGGAPGSSGQNPGEGDAPNSAGQAPQDDIDRLIAQTDRIAMGYDYDRAISTLTESGADQSEPRIAAALSRYQEEKAALVPADLKNVTHVFFHSLIMDTAKAFDGDRDANGYNSVMTTKSEFLKILEEMHKRGYVLVRLHDIAQEVTNEDGSTSFQWGTVLLPEGRKPFVMSQDDLCYYAYMEGDGFASRMVIGDDGKPTCEMVMDDGSVERGPFDLVPLLEDFIEEHPDFSYKGARAVLAFTGYQGILGYRTSSDYSDSPTYQEDRAEAARVAQCLKDNGWELASHSWGHLQLGVANSPENEFAVEDSRFITDTDKWEDEVESLIGPTDILIFPYGNDIADWHPYTEDNPRFAYLKSKGFRYFCNVDASKLSWIQMGKDSLRMARMNLDGYRLYEDMVQTDPEKKKLADLFDAAQIFDTARPTPVSWSYQ